MSFITTLRKKILQQPGLMIRVALLCALGVVLAVLILNPSPARKLYAACESQSSSEREQCYNKAFEVYTRSHGPEAAFIALRELQRIDPSTVGCHFIAHGIGHGAYQRNPQQWQKDFRGISEECSYGAMHGVLELAIRDIPGGLTQEFLPNICGKNPRADCNHIVGHLTLIETGADVPKALSYCRVLEEALQYEFCSSGVFMEMETATNLITHGLADASWLDWAARRSTLEEMCRAQRDSTDATQCWKELAHVFVVSAETDAAQTFAYCTSGTPSEKATEECMTHAVGILIASSGFSDEALHATCAAFSSYGSFTLCAVYAVSSLLSSLPYEAASAVQFCSNIPHNSQHDCFAEIGNMRAYNTNDTDTYARACVQAPEPYRTECSNGGNIDATFAPDIITHPPLVDEL